MPRVLMCSNWSCLFSQQYTQTYLHTYTRAGVPNYPEGYVSAGLQGPEGSRVAGSGWVIRKRQDTSSPERALSILMDLLVGPRIEERAWKNLGPTFVANVYEKRDTS